MCFYPRFINPPHPFSIVLSRFWYFTQDLLRTIEHLEIEIQDLALGSTSNSVIIEYFKTVYMLGGFKNCLYMVGGTGCFLSQV